MNLINMHMGMQALMADLLGQHRAIAAQDAFSATTLQYIVNLESRLLAITNPTELPTFPPSAEAQHLMVTYSEMSRARYDKMTESTRRAEALGLLINGSMRQPASPVNKADINPDFSASQLPYGSLQQQRQLQPSQPLHPRHLQSHVQQHQHQQPYPHASHLHQPHHSYFPTQNLKQPQTGSPTTTNATDSSHDSLSSFANLGDIRLGARTGEPGVQTSGLSSGVPGDSNMSYFSAPGAPMLRPSLAITPGALMVSTLNDTHYQHARETSREESEEEMTPNSDLTAANTSRNQDQHFSAEGEDTATFAAALRGGQSSATVRSALTSQPLLVRRATYIPGWSVPPRVLLVEDDPVCRNLTTKFLQLFGCTIDVATDGVEAVNKMQSGVYDIAMMDISMPNLDGKPCAFKEILRRFCSVRLMQEFRLLH